MPILWLRKMVDSLGGSSDPELEGGFSQQVLDILDRHASWRDTGGTRVQWMTDPATATVTPRDCVVYFVGNYSSGVAWRLVRSSGVELSDADRRTVDALNLAELGITWRYAESEPTVSEVHLAKCRRALGGGPSSSVSGWSAHQLEQYPLVLAVVAWHEAMHNKVEPHMGRDWDLHADGGGAWAGSIPFGPAGGYAGAAAPSDRNVDLMRSRFGRDVPQYLADR